MHTYETACPFCAQAVSFGELPPVVEARQTARLSRSARVALGAALAAGLPACGGSAQPPDGPAAPAPTSTIAAPDDAPPDDDGAPAAEYGAPAPPDDDGSGAAEYGAPMPPDDDGAPGTKYGGPPQ